MSLADRLFAPVERLVAALIDPMRRERAIIGVLAGYAVIWTLYGAIAKGSQDIHFDMAEIFADSHEPGLGIIKHPPFPVVIAGAWFMLFPAADWAYYLLAMVSTAFAMWIAWRISERYLDGNKRIFGLALLTMVPFYNFQALKFNNNTILIPLWAVATLLFLRSIETRRVRDSIFAGMAAAATTYGKYWSAILLAGLGIAALIDRRRMAYFRSAAPWVTIAAGAIAVAPNAYFIISADFAPLHYAFAIHGDRSLAVMLTGSLNYLAASFGYIALPVIVSVAVTRPNCAAIKDMMWPEDTDRRLVAVAFLATLLVPIALALTIRFELTALWTMSAWTLLPVVLLSSPFVIVTRIVAVRITAAAILMPLILLAVSPLIASAIHRGGGVISQAAHGSLLAERVAQIWRETTSQPLRFVGGDAVLIYAAAFYIPERPSAFPGTDRPPWIEQGELARSGIVLLCPSSDVQCVRMIDAHAGAAGRRIELELARSYLGVAGPASKYLVILVPPRSE
jgi:Dolichyl-phosphate-mannose-protein mannosyltransferase